MADRTRTITIKVDDKFSTVLRKYSRAMGTAEDANESFSKQATGGFKNTIRDLDRLTNAVGGMVSAFSAISGTVQEFNQLGLTARRNRAALESLNATAADVEERILAVRDATRQQTTASEAAAIASRLQQFGLAESAEEMSKFVDTIIRVSAVNPMLGDTSNAINEIQLTLNNMSFLRLDQLGISSGVVRKRIKELQAETADLTKEQAFQIATMEELEKQANRVSDSVLEIGGAQARVSTRIRSAKESIGIALSETLDEAFVVADQLAFLLDEIGTEETVVRITAEITGLDTPQAQTLISILSAGGEFVGQGLLDITGASAAIDAAGFIQNQLADPDAAPDPRGAGRGARPVGQFPGDTSQFTQTGFSLIPFGGGQIPGGPEIPASGLRVNIVEINPRAALRIGDALPEIPLPDIERDFQRAALEIAAAVQGATPDQVRSGIGTLGLTGVSPLTSGGTRRVTVDPPQVSPIVQAQRTGRDLVGVARRETERRSDQAGDFFQTLTDQLPQITSELTGAVTAAGELVTTFAEAPPVNLADKFNITPDSFDVDVLSRVSGALRDSGVEADIAAAAMDRYKLATGITTASSEVFDRQIETLTAQLDEGAITTDEYVDSILELQNLDFSAIDQATKDLSADDLEKVIDSFGTLDASQIEAAGPALDQFGEGLQKIFDLSGDEEENPFDKLTVDVEEVVSDSVRLLEVLEGAGGRTFETIANTGKAELSTLKSVTEEQIGEMKEILESIETVKFAFTATTTLNGTEIGGASTTTAVMHQGGIVPGSGNVPAILEGGEGVVSRRNMQALLSTPMSVGGGSGERIVIENKLLLPNGRELTGVVSDTRRLENKPF